MPGVTSCRYAPMSAEQVHPHGGDLAVGVGGQLDVLDLPAALDGGVGVLAAALRPPRRHAELPGDGEGDELLGVHVELRAEPAADRRRDHPELVLGHAGGGREHHLEDVRDLGGRPHGDLAAVGLRHHRHAARLHGRRDQPLLDVALLHHVGGVGEGGVDRGLVGDELPRVALVGAEGVVDHDAVGQRVVEVDDRLERLVAHVDGADGVGRRVAASRPRRPRRCRRRSTPCRWPPGSAPGSSCPR